MRAPRLLLLASLLRSLLGAPGWTALPLAALVSGCGVETYRERPPAASLSIRRVAAAPAAAGDSAAAEPRDVDLLPRWGRPDEMLPVERVPVVSARHVRHVRLLDAADGSRVIVLDLDDLGRARLAEATTASVGRRLAIVVDGQVVAAPTVQTPLTEGEAYVVVAPEQLEPAFAALSRPPAAP